jgi:hypothetical protein
MPFISGLDLTVRDSPSMSADRSSDCPLFGPRTGRTRFTPDGQFLHQPWPVSLASAVALDNVVRAIGLFNDNMQISTPHKSKSTLTIEVKLRIIDYVTEVF